MSKEDIATKGDLEAHKEQIDQRIFYLQRQIEEYSGTIAIAEYNSGYRSGKSDGLKEVSRVIALLTDAMLLIGQANPVTWVTNEPKIKYYHEAYQWEKRAWELIRRYKGQKKEGSDEIKV
jgi:hypothetical protein